MAVAARLYCAAPCGETLRSTNEARDISCRAAPAAPRVFQCLPIPENLAEVVAHAERACQTVSILYGFAEYAEANCLADLARPRGDGETMSPPGHTRTRESGCRSAPAAGTSPPGCLRRRRGLPDPFDPRTSG